MCLKVDMLVETKGMDYMDREKAKRHAKQQAEQMYDQQYGGRDINSSGNTNWGYLGNQYGVGSGMGGGYGMQQGERISYTLLSSVAASSTIPKISISFLPVCQVPCASLASGKHLPHL